jgi:hypothetical protein
MKRRASNTQTPRVNILKKINVNGAWKLMPSALESNGKLKIGSGLTATIETYPEGTY